MRFFSLNIFYYPPPSYRRLNPKHKINIFIPFNGKVQTRSPLVILSEIFHLTHSLPQY